MRTAATAPSPRTHRPILAPQTSALLCALALALLQAAAPVQAAEKAAGKVAEKAGATPVTAGSNASCPATLDFRFPRLQDEAPQNLCQYAGKVVLVVNTASYCGFTPQYQGLEALHARYSARGLVVLGFPSNDFEQEADSAKEIADLCYNTYGVRFPMLAKSHVRGDKANPMYALLARQSGTAPKWNFHKYLIDRNGKVVANYPSKVAPDNAELVSRIEQLLSQPGQR